MRQTRSNASSGPRGQKRPGVSRTPGAAASVPGDTRARRPTGQPGDRSRSGKQRPRQSSPRAQEAIPGEPLQPELALLSPSPVPVTQTSAVATLDLGDQRERWESFQKRQKLTFEGAAKLLLDTFEYQGLVKHTGGCHCGAVRFEVWASADLHIFDCKWYLNYI
uniref:Centromere protein V n=1 Tax=Molossus molossus TaxID=27622 RepID=A0A7J8BKJ8_MOLMO|nr:centromere protein V [Molossus molossus]